MQVKFCGLTRPADALAAARAGAHYLGVVFAPGGRRTVAADQAAALFHSVPAAVRRVGVFVNAPPDQVRRIAEAAGLHVVQLHGDELPATVRALRAEGRFKVWKAVRPRTGADFLAALEQFGDTVDGLLLDGWSATARGGTGQSFPWRAVEPHRELVPPSVALVAAGGLHRDNVAAAVQLLRPTVVDVSSGIEHSPGIKNAGAMAEFAAQVEAASAARQARSTQGSAPC